MSSFYWIDSLVRKRSWKKKKKSILNKRISVFTKVLNTVDYKVILKELENNFENFYISHHFNSLMKKKKIRKLLIKLIGME